MRKFDAELFKSLQSSGLSASQIAARMGVTARTVQRWRGRLGLLQRSDSPFATRPITTDRLERACALLEDGASRREVMRSVGVSYDTLRRHFPDLKWRPGDGNYGRMFRELNRLGS